MRLLLLLASVFLSNNIAAGQCSFLTKEGDSFKFEYKGAEKKSIIIDLPKERLTLKRIGERVFIEREDGKGGPIKKESAVKKEGFEAFYQDKAELSCTFKKKLTKKKREVPITILSTLSSLGREVEFKVTDYLAFPFEQKEEQGLMRSLFFQKGQMYEKSRRLNKNFHWCSLRVRIKHRKTVIIDKGVLLRPHAFEKYQNSTQFDTYSYNFLESTKLEFGQRDRPYIPFSFQCNITRGSKFNVGALGIITGNKFIVSREKEVKKGKTRLSE